MNGDEFIRRIRKLAKESGQSVRFEERHGKGSHGRLYYGTGFTTLKDRKKEIGRGLLNAMLNQLGINQDEFFCKKECYETVLSGKPDTAGRWQLVGDV